LKYWWMSSKCAMEMLQVLFCYIVYIYVGPTGSWQFNTTADVLHNNSSFLIIDVTHWLLGSLWRVDSRPIQCCNDVSRFSRQSREQCLGYTKLFSSWEKFAFSRVSFTFRLLIILKKDITHLYRNNKTNGVYHFWKQT